LDAKRYPLNLTRRMRAVVDSMGHLLLSPTNDEVGVRFGAVDAASDVVSGSEEMLALAADPTYADDDNTRSAPPVRPDTLPLSAQAQADGALVRRVQNGDMAAFEELFNKYKGVIYRTALAITRDPGIAEEVLQDCFYKAYINIDRIQPDLPLTPWLHRVAVNLSCNALKRRRHWLEPIENLAERLFADPHHSPENLLELSELQGTLRDIVNLLPLKHRVVVVLHYLQELSLPEIAAILECPVGTVKSRLHYARKVLKLEMEARYLAEQSTPATGVVQPQKV
jgi:RNA polymerase sigma-70 factor (ECF subfamily)